MSVKYLAPTIPVIVCAKWTGNNIEDLQQVGTFVQVGLNVTDNGDGTATVHGGYANGSSLNVNDWLVAVLIPTGHIQGVSDEIRSFWSLEIFRLDDIRAQYLVDNATNGRGTWQLP